MSANEHAAFSTAVGFPLAGGAEAVPEIVTFESSDRRFAEWDDYVRGHPNGSAFHLRAWQVLIESAFGHRPRHLAAIDPATGRVMGVLPLFLVKSWLFGRLLISTPMAAYGGVLADADSIAQSLLDRARLVAIADRVKFLELRTFGNPVHDPSLTGRDLYVTFRQELSPDPEWNMAAIPRKTRAEIREGIKHGLEFRVDDIGADGFFDIYAQSVHALGTPVFPRRLFADGPALFGENCRIFSVHWNGRTVAAVWTLFYKNEVVPYFGGSIRPYNHLAPNNFMYWMLIKYGCEHGYRVFDFGRSKKGTGSFDFKKRWGMVQSDLPYQYDLLGGDGLPDTSPLNAKYSRRIALWRKLPLSVANTVGPLISRHLI
jgi:FemAB-related protein (PEP-CTERM system-associated)